MLIPVLCSPLIKTKIIDEETRNRLCKLEKTLIMENQTTTEALLYVTQQTRASNLNDPILRDDNDHFDVPDITAMTPVTKSSKAKNLIQKAKNFEDNLCYELALKAYKLGMYFKSLEIG
jgi:hypothetical protein